MPGNGDRLMAEHPRPRGENGSTSTTRSTADGASPTARGERPGRNRVIAPPRSIPDRAGRTASVSDTLRPKSEHPRPRGENPATVRSVAGSDGASPTARGERLWWCGSALVCRSIPDRAGRTLASGRSRGPAPEHPRPRGENVTAAASAGFWGGASPTARGELDRQFLASGGQRSIPDRAGRTRAQGGVRRHTAEHPRPRGENAYSAMVRTMVDGASPTARGELGRWPAQKLVERSIPDRAGRTTRRRDRTGPPSEHPRPRGENGRLRACSGSPGGASPTARGEPFPTCSALSALPLLCF